MRSMNRTGFVAVLIALAACVNAEEAVKTITVSGTGSAPATPDRASLVMSIVVRDKSLQTAQKEAASVAAKVLAITDGLDIDRSQVDTSGASIQADYHYNTGNRVFQGYIASRQITVEFRDLDNLAEVIEGGVAAGVNQVSPPNLFSTRQKEAYREALDNAAQDARANAERLADSLDVKLGSAITVTTAQSGYPIPHQRAGFNMAMAEDVGASYNAGDQVVQATVTVVFAID